MDFETLMSVGRDAYEEGEMKTNKGLGKTD